MTLFSLLQSSPALLFCVCGILGLFVGSFLNVVVYRLPLMMQANWRRECTEFLSQDANPDQNDSNDQQNAEPEKTEPFNLMVPRSACPSCGKMITAWQNIPVLSWLLLRGKCSNCKNPISAEYPWSSY